MTITETREKTVCIEAKDRQEAYSNTISQYNENQVILAEDEVIDVDLEIGESIIMHDIPYTELLETGKDDGIELCICDMEDLNFYGIQIDGNEYHIFQKDKDTLWISKAIIHSVGKENEKLRVSQLENSTDEYQVMKYEDFSYMSFETYIKAVTDHKKNSEKIYCNVHGKDYFIIHSSIPFQEMTAKKLHEQHRKEEQKELQLHRKDKML